MKREDSGEAMEASVLGQGSEPKPTGFPIIGVGLRGYWARRDVCPECGGDLDTGWECNSCGFDAKAEAHPDA